MQIQSFFQFLFDLFVAINDTFIKEVLKANLMNDPASIFDIHQNIKILRIIGYILEFSFIGSMLLIFLDGIKMISNSIINTLKKPFKVLKN